MGNTPLPATSPRHKLCRNAHSRLESYHLEANRECNLQHIGSQKNHLNTSQTLMILSSQCPRREEIFSWLMIKILPFLIYTWGTEAQGRLRELPRFKQEVSGRRAGPPPL
uniref:Uncharacterized protein n=1 Tax=Pelusios castaneus TaxID=367368 RepID=A0A8C8SHJ7_9SAUR